MRTNFIGLMMAALLLGACDPAFDAERDPATVDWEYPPGMLETPFTSAKEQLNAILYTANGAGPHPTVLLLHGWPGNEKNLDLAQYLRRAGWNVFFFHYRGAWGSEGVFSFLNAAEDVAAALAHLRASGADYRVDKEQIAVVGHSMGGTMALAGSSKDPAISCVATIAAAGFEPNPEFLANAEAVKQFEKYADRLIMLRGHDGSNFLSQLSAFRALHPLSKVAAGLEGKKVLLVAAQKDTVVPIAVHEKIASEFGRHSAIQLSTRVFDTDHGFSTHRIALARHITRWLGENCRQSINNDS